MPDDATEFHRAFQALLDRYQKARVLAALQETPLRPGPKRKDDTEILIRMGRIVTWHRDLSDRAAAEIVTRHLPNNRSSVIDRIRKGFAKDRQYYLRSGRVTLVDAVLHEDAVGAYAGLAGVAVFRGDATLTAISMSATARCRPIPA